MVWGIFKADSISETYKKMKAEQAKVAETEQLDEISKEKLRGYVDRATYDVDDKREVQQGHYQKSAHHKSQGNHIGASIAKRKGDASGKAADKRATNIDKAKQKLAKEEVELDELISEVLSADQDAGKWISDFVKSDNPKFAGKSPEKRKQMALAAYYAAQKKESTDYESFIELDEEVQGEIVKTGAKEIKHANIKDKQNDQDVMEPHSKGEADFLDKHSIEVTDDPATDGAKTGSDKLKHASEPKGSGAGKYDAKGKTGVKESTGEDTTEEASDEAATSETAGEATVSEESCSSKGKKSYTAFKNKVMKK